MTYLPIPSLDASEIERFNSKIDKSGECWSWTAWRDKDGYGQIKLRRKSYRASRVAYRLHTGNAPGDLEVCHTCDNPPCVNPAHLFLGTTKDNQRDKWRKGRENPAFNLPENKARGHRINTSKLTEQQAIEIIDRLKRGESLTAIGRVYGVTKQSIRAIRTGQNWKHLPR